MGRCNSVGMNALIVTTRGKHGSRVEGGRERGHCAGFRRMMIRKVDDGEIFNERETKVTNNVGITQETLDRWQQEQKCKRSPIRREMKRTVREMLASKGGGNTLRA